MPRIDPQQLLKCLSVLLSPNGGIKSKEEVQRLASLMTKFSKKLVSKCIYVSILKATETDLLIMFMSAGGWDLTYSWLSDGVAAKNWPLVTELVNLLLICPVDIDRLKTNACPKLIKTLSKDPNAAENVRLLACKLVEQWLRIVRGDNDASTSKPEQPPQAEDQVVPHPQPPKRPEQSSQDDEEPQEKSNVNSNVVKNESSEETSDGHLPVYKITIRDGKKVLAEISGDRRSSTEAPEEDCSTGTEDINQDEEEEPLEEVEEDEPIKPVKLKKKSPTKPNKITKKPGKITGSNKKERESSDDSGSVGKSPIRQKDNVKAVTKKIKEDSPRANKSFAKNKANATVKVKESVKSGSKDTEELAGSKPKGKISLSLKNKKGSLKDKEKSEIKPDKIEAKEKIKFDDNDSLTDKEKESLSKFITPPISKVGKIPKKTSLNKEEKQSEEKNRTLKEEDMENRSELKKSFEMKKPEMKKPEIKRPEKKYSISVEPKRSIASDSRPKTVKTYNSKFRSTGLEEEVKPPPPRPVPKKISTPFPPVLSLTDKKLGKRSSPPPSESPIPEKKIKPESPQEEKKPIEKAGGIKLIPPKPKPMFLQESDVFMDAMLAANTMKEPRKRKRRPSTSKESGQSDPKKDAPSGGINSPNQSPKSDDSFSVKPTFKFYQDTLDTSTEEDKSDGRVDDESLDFNEPDSNPEDTDDQKPSSPSEHDKTSKLKSDRNGPLKGVLVVLKSKRQKKSVTWNETELECIKYFELDETERVNVTKNFADMKNMEREHERENFQIARKLAVDDIMEERTRWRALIPIDIAAPVVAPGKNSQEKEIQYAREKTVAAAVYFNKRTIPDSPAEPDLEIHATTDPVSIPLDDITGSTDSINDYTNTPWPEPRGQPPAPVAPAPPVQQPSTFQPGPAPFAPAPFPPMGPYMPAPGPGMPMPAAGDCWRTGDGKVVPIPTDMFPPQGMMPGAIPTMGPTGPMMMPPGVSPEMPFPMGMPGPNPSPEEMAHYGGGFPQMGPSPPHQMFGPPPPPPPHQGPPQGVGFQNSGGGNWQNQVGGGGGNWYQGNNDNDQPHPPHHNQGGSGRYQGNNWRGRGGRNRKYSDGWGGGGNSRTPICNNILKKGFCRNNNCRFRHPR